MTTTSFYHLAKEKKNTKLSKQVVNSTYVELKKKISKFFTRHFVYKHNLFFIKYLIIIKFCFKVCLIVILGSIYNISNTLKFLSFKY